MKFLVLSSILLSCFLAQSNPNTNQEELNKRLYLAVKNGEKLEDIKKLVEAGADVNAKVKIHNNADFYFLPTIHVVKNLETARFLVEEAGADVNIKAAHPSAGNALVYQSNMEILRFLVDSGTDINGGDASPVRGLRSPSVNRFLLENGADPNHDMPLHPLQEFTLENGRLLLEYGADPNYRRKRNGQISLHSCFTGYNQQMRLLIEAGGDVNAQDNKGRTPLHTVPSLDCARVLLENGADPYIRDKEGKIARIIRRHPHLLELSTVPKKECQYTTKSSQIQATQCGRRHICMAEVSCGFSVDLDSDILIERNFQVVCSSLPNGECPEANDCALDRSVVEAEEAQTASSSSSSGTTAPKKSSSGVR